MPDERTLNWRPNRPRGPGWYWLRMQGTDAMVVELKRSNRGLVATWPGRIYPDPIRRPDYDSAEWCGPLAPPSA